MPCEGLEYEEEIIKYKAKLGKTSYFMLAYIIIVLALLYLGYIEEKPRAD